MSDFRFFYENLLSKPVKSVSINFATLIDATGVAAKIDGKACPSPKVVKVILEERRKLFRVENFMSLISRDLQRFLFERCSG